MNPKPLYRVRDFEKNFMKSDSRKSKDMKWVAIPTKHDGKSYKRLMRKDPQFYLAWTLILQVACKCPIRGLLADGDGALGAEDLNMKTDCPTKIFERAFGPLCEVGWLEKIDDPELSTQMLMQAGCADFPIRSDDNELPEHRDAVGITSGCRRDAVGMPSGLQDKTLQYNTEHTSPISSGDVGKALTKADQIENIYQAYPKKTGKQAALARIGEALRDKSYETLLEATQAYAAAVKTWPAGDLKYVPDPERWFKKGRYDDDRATWTRNGGVAKMRIEKDHTDPDIQETLQELWRENGVSMDQ